MQEKQYMSKEEEALWSLRLTGLVIKTLEDLKDYAKGQILAAGVIERRPVLLKHAGDSGIYANVKKLYGDPNLMSWLGFAMCYLITPEPTSIAASGYGGIPLACDIQRRSELPLTLVRETSKAHGLSDEIIGYVPKLGDRVAVVDDVVTTGRSLQRTVDTLQRAGAIVQGCYAVVNRGDAKLDVPLTSLFTLEELMK